LFTPTSIHFLLFFILIQTLSSSVIANEHTDKSIQLTTAEQQFLDTNPVIDYTGDPNWLPFEAFTKEGKYIGIVADHLQLIEQKLPLKFNKIIPANWSDALNIAIENRANIISGDAADKILNKKFIPIDSYINNPIIIIMKNSHGYVDQLNELADKKIAIIKDYGYTADVYQKYPSINFIEVENIQKALLGVETGQYDAVLASLALASYSIQQMGFEQLSIVGKTDIIMNVTLFINKKLPILHSIINKAMHSIKTVEHQNILTKWRHTQTLVQIDYSYLWKALALFSTIFLLLIYRHYLLKKQQLKLMHQALIIEQTHDSIIATDLEGYISSWNIGSELLLGYKADEIIGEHISMIYLQEDLESLEENIKRLKQNGDYHSTIRLVSKSNKIIDADLSLSLLRDDQGKMIGMIGYSQDVSQRKKAENALEESNYNLQQYLDVIDKINIGLFVVDANYHVRYMNDTMVNWFGDQSGKICYSSVAKLDKPCPYCKLKDVIVENKKVIYEPETPDGQYFDIVATSIKNADGTISKMEVIRNVTDKKNAQEYLLKQKEKLAYQAHHDALTGLANRLLFTDRLTKSIEKSNRHNTKMALLFIDLDHFKEINDSLGHDVGDDVLKDITQRLKKLIRKEDTLARLGGDEFTIILEDLKQGQNASLLAQKIIKSIAKPINIENNRLYVSSSIGISLYPEDGDNPQNLLKYADSAMYKAKDEGRNNFQFYSAEMTKLAFERVVMESSFRESLKNEDFIVYYQPQMNTNQNKLIGMEALVRWRHPTMGIVSPAKFIPLAETTGLIIELDQFVMKTAMKQMKLWYQNALNPGVLALNLSIKQLQQKDFISILNKLLIETQCKPHWIELEVTEGQVMTNPEQAIKVLNKIYSMGINLSVDDFGTGYSSLSYLKKLPINKLKIDQSFVRGLPDDEEDSAIARSIIALAQSLNLDIIAEGVETKEQEKFMVNNGCENIQGYLYSKPIPADKVEKYLKKG